MDLNLIYNQLSQNSKRMIDQTVQLLAAQDGITVSLTTVHAPPLEHIKLWLANLKTEGKSPRTIDLYDRCARMVLRSVPEPDYLALQGYFAQRLDTAGADHVNTEQKAIRSMLKYLYKQGLYPSDPTRDIKLIHGAFNQVNFPSDEQIQAVLHFQPRRVTDRAKYRVMLVLLISTGLRIEEACSLRRALINYSAREIKVLGKGNKERTVPLSALVVSLLEDYTKNQCITESPFVFPGNTKSGYWNGSGFDGMLRIACKRAGLRPISPHKLRHYFATKTLEHGAKLEIISKILGHSSVAITAQVYRHIQVKEFHAELDAHDPMAQLPKLIEGGKSNE